MASPEALQLEQKSRALKLKEEALTRQAEQQLLTEKRIKDHQQNVAEKERANQLKAQDLIGREKKYKEEILSLNKERQDLLDAQQTLEKSRPKPFVLIVPFLLLACIVAGYFAYEQLNKKEQHFEQVTVASENIDKLAKLLNSSQDEVLLASGELINKKNELNKTKSMLLGLKNTINQLQLEITQLKGNQETTESERLALAFSANTLSDQLAILKTQLEDKYLTNDINEAYIDYQQHDLNAAKTALSSQIETVQEKEHALTLKENQQKTLEDSLKNKEQLLLEQGSKTLALNDDLEKVKKQLENLQVGYTQLENQNAKLENENNSLKQSPAKK